eukprot:4695387-Alexandrium_andersonii.AAC.1
MSASLVGSEMCIRDRLLPPDRSAVRHCSWRFRHWRARVPPSLVQPPRAGCLLYTSDAADDM